MQYFEKFLKDIHSLKLKTTSKNGQEFLTPLGYFDNYYVKNNMTKALVVRDLLVLSEIQLQYQLNSIALILEKFIILFDLGGQRKCLNWLVNQPDPFDKNLNTDEMDEEILDYVDFLKGEGLTTKEAINSEIWMWADECLFIEVENESMIIDDPKVFFGVIENKISHSINMLKGLIFDIETITNKKPLLFKTDEELKKQVKVSKNPKSNRRKHDLNDAQIDALRMALIEEKYIAQDTTIEQFKEPFNSEVTKMATKIQWLADTRLLVYCLDNIFVKKGWPTELECKEAFPNNNGEVLTAQNIYTSLSQMNKSGFPRGSDKIDTIIDKIRKQNA